jgi:hypothetical protein
MKAPKRINFIPPELRPSLVNARTFAFALLLALVGGPSAWIGIAAMERHYAKSYAEKVATRDDLEKQIQNHVRLRAEAKDFGRLAAIEKALAAKLFWAEAFKELGAIAPAQVWLNRFEAKIDDKGRRVVITGSSVSPEVMAEFYARLERSFYFRDVRIRYAEADENYASNLYRFQFEGTVFEAGKEALSGSL